MQTLINALTPLGITTAVVEFAHAGDLYDLYAISTDDPGDNPALLIETSLPDGTMLYDAIEECAYGPITEHAPTFGPEGRLLINFAKHSAVLERHTPTGVHIARQIPFE